MNLSTSLPSTSSPSTSSPSTSSPSAFLATSAHTGSGLRWPGLATALLGVGFAVFAVLLPGPLEEAYRVLAHGDTAVDLHPTARLATGIYGGLMAGWGVTMALLGGGRSPRRAVAVGALTWWLVDSASSIATGFAWNAVSNTLFLLLFAPVLLAARREASGPLG